MKKLLLLLLALFCITVAFPQRNSWSAVQSGALKGKELLERTSHPAAYNLFSLNIPQLKSQLAQAPMRGSGLNGVVINFPSGDGKIISFTVYEAPVMHAGLSALHPEIKAYAGHCIEDPTAYLRMTETIFGVHVMVLSSKGTYFIDPYTKDLSFYIVYKKKNLRSENEFACEFDDEVTGNKEGAKTFGPASPQSDDSTLRTYRLALACTIEYAAYHVNAAGLNGGTTEQKKAAVLAAMNITMARVNGVYERDLSITMEIVANNENVIFINSDSYTNNNASAMLNQNQSTLNANIGNANYDIGHVVSTGGGGLAILGCVCSTNNKAKGVTGSPSPVGDPFDIDYVAHEMGHQFGASHTFNGNTGSCSGNANPSTAVEPGSGSTIMAYAGICPGANVQNNSDDYFHTVSLDQIFSFVNSSGSCAVETPNDNTPPAIPALAWYTIPKGTAFVLTGSATDAESNQSLTFCWEQVNANGASASTPLPTSTSGPNFRSLPPTASPQRYFPRLEDVLNGNLTPTWEVIPNVARTFNFALTVRDNDIVNGGQTDKRTMTVNVNASAGPFAVTSQNENNLTWESGQQQTITWNVAGTTANNINTSQVNILLSTDGGQTFSTVLAQNTPNDGTEVVTVPDVEAPFCRIMVQAADNIYYAVNAQDFSIGVEIIENCNTYTYTNPAAIPDNASNYSALAVNVTNNEIITSVNYTVDISHTFISDLLLLAVSPANTQVQLWELQCNGQSGLSAEFSDAGLSVTCSSPTTGTIQPQEPLSAFNGESSAGQWIFAFADVFEEDAGTVNSWAVEICTLSTNSLSSNGLKDFSLYPNPNSGSFTVAFTSQNGNDIAIKVHDMRGREVFTQSYQNTGMFSGNVNLGAVQQGVYLVTVQDGARKEVRKIVIQ